MLLISQPIFLTANIVLLQRLCGFYSLIPLIANILLRQWCCWFFSLVFSHSVQYCWTVLLLFFVPAERVRAGDYETGSVRVCVCLCVRVCVRPCVRVYVCASVCDQNVQFASSLSFVNRF